MKALVLDCESTGLGPQDQPITIGAVMVDLDEKWTPSIIGEWYGEQEPTVQISAGAAAVHGLSRAVLAGKSFDLDALGAIVADAEVLIAHNCSFDARMIGSVLPAVRDKEWRCSCRQWPWPAMDNRKLDTALAHFDIDRGTHHHAMGDALALHEALSRRSGKTARSMTFYGKLIRQRPFWVEPTRKAVEISPPVPPQPPALKFNWFDREGLKKIARVGLAIPLKISAPGIIAGEVRDFLWFKKTICTLTAAENPKLAEALRRGDLVNLVVTEWDGANIAVTARATSKD